MIISNTINLKATYQFEKSVNTIAWLSTPCKSSYPVNCDSLKQSAADRTKKILMISLKDNNLIDFLISASDGRAIGLFSR